jgi:hypothetical protein
MLPLSAEEKSMRLVPNIVLAVLLTIAARAQQLDVPPSAPDSFQFAEGHAYLGSEQVKWERGRLIFIRRVADLSGKGGFHQTTEQLKPTEEAWARFWKRVDAAGVWQWQSTYTSPRADMPDGESWSLELRRAGHHVKSHAYNATPPEYSALRNAVYALLDEARQSKPPSGGDAK